MIDFGYFIIEQVQEAARQNDAWAPVYALISRSNRAPLRFPWPEVPKHRPRPETLNIEGFCDE